VWFHTAVNFLAAGNSLRINLVNAFVYREISLCGKSFITDVTSVQAVTNVNKLVFCKRFRISEFFAANITDVRFVNGVIVSVSL